MDDATRARLDDAKDWLRRDDLEALLAAYDALRAERDAEVLEVTQLAEEERTFIEIRRDEWMEIANTLRAERDALQAHLEEGMRMLLALQAERDQAAPVLVAAEAWWASPGGYTARALMQAVVAWRAAREGG